METIPYTYKLIFKPTGQYYYGVRWAEGCSPEDLWIKYYSSSKYIHQLIKEYGKDSFIYRVTKTFTNKEDASEWELKLLKRVNAALNPKFINRHNNTKIYSVKGLKWIHHTETDMETLHDPNLPIPSGWKYGHSKMHKLNNKKSHTKLYKSGEYVPWNKGGGKPTGPCTETRKKAIKKARLNTKKLKCPYCQKSTDPGNYNLWHGDNCKLNPNIDPKILKTRSEKAKASMVKQKKNGTFSKPKVPVGIFKCSHCTKESSNYGAMQRHHFNNCKFKNH